MSNTQVKFYTNVHVLLYMATGVNPCKLKIKEYKGIVGHQRLIFC